MDNGRRDFIKTMALTIVGSTLIGIRFPAEDFLLTKPKFFDKSVNIVAINFESGIQLQFSVARNVCPILELEDVIKVNCNHGSQQLIKNQSFTITNIEEISDA